MSTSLAISSWLLFMPEIKSTAIELGMQSKQNTASVNLFWTTKAGPPHHACSMDKNTGWIHERKVQNQRPKSLKQKKLLLPFPLICQRVNKHKKRTHPALPLLRISHLLVFRLRSTGKESRSSSKSSFISLRRFRSASLCETRSSGDREYGVSPF